MEDLGRITESTGVSLETKGEYHPQPLIPNYCVRMRKLDSEEGRRGERKKDSFEIMVLEESSTNTLDCQKDK